MAHRLKIRDLEYVVLQEVNTLLIIKAPFLTVRGKRDAFEGSEQGRMHSVILDWN